MDTIAGIGGTVAVLMLALMMYLLFAQERIWHYSKQQTRLLEEIRDQLARRDWVDSRRGNGSDDGTMHVERGAPASAARRHQAA